MHPSNYKIVNFEDHHRTALIAVWEKSVLATHDFLAPHDFIEIKALVNSIDFHAFQVYCLLDDQQVIGFTGVVDQKIEMLFLSPEYFGQGLGKKLLQFCIDNLNAQRVDVNEQNEKALSFYIHCGFIPYERTAVDDQGKNYPLLRLQRNPLPC